MKPQHLEHNPHKQCGVVLIVGLVMLLLTTIIGLNAMQSSILNEKMAANQQDQYKAIQAAESAARYAWTQLDKSTGFNIANFTNNAAHNGFYDLRPANVVTTSGNKLIADWNSISSTGAWPWDGSTERAVMPNKLADSDPMGLAAAPQFAIGMHAPILRKGTENFKCIPFTIIGAGQGSNGVSKSLIQLKVIPASGCYRDLVN